jgi:hypothetical protein
MAYTFVVSDESINSYGFRVLTDGIDLKQFKKNPIMLYMHKRNTWEPTGDEVIGRWENIRKEKGKLLADAVFDEENEFAKKIASKVKGGFIKMASIGIVKKEVSTEKKHLKSGQTRATVTKSNLNEISIVDMGGNDNALKLYKDNGDDFKIEELNIKTQNMKDYKVFALALGLEADATENEVLSEIATLQKDKKTAETIVETLAQAEKEAKETEAKDIIAGASAKLKLEGDAKVSFEKNQTALFNADHDNAKTALAMLVSGLEKTTPANGDKSIALGKFMKDVNGNDKGTVDAKLSYDYLQKHNVAELKRIKKDEPEAYAELVANYAKGERYTK